MKYAIIENNKVVNIVLSDFQIADNWVIADDTAEIQGGWDGQSFTPFVPDSNEIATKIRSIRDNLLKDCDWTQISDSPVNKAVWSIYRQALRDIPSQSGFPHNISWPEKP